MKKTYNEMVNHLTQVTLHLQPDEDSYSKLADGAAVTARQVRDFSRVLAERAERVAGMMDALAEQGFTFSMKKDRIIAESAVVEAFEAKQHLIARGFHDREFQIFLEYARKWDVL